MDDNEKSDSNNVTSSGSSSKTNSNVTIDICQNDKCDRVIDGKNRIESIECDGCKRWICIKCENLKITDIKIIEKSEKIDGLNYECKTCKIKQIEMIEKNNNMKQELAIAKLKIQEYVDSDFTTAENIVKIKELEEEKVENDIKIKKLEDEIVDNRQTVSNLRKEMAKYAEKLNKMRDEENIIRDALKQSLMKIEDIQKTEKNNTTSMNNNKVNRLNENNNDETERREPREVSGEERIKKNESIQDIETQRLLEIIQERQKSNDSSIRQRSEYKETSRETQRESYENRERICKRFSLYLDCRFGDQCRYKHIRICKEFIKGHCRYRRECRFSHDTSHLCNRENTMIGCRFGSRCRYGHIRHLINENNNHQKERYDAQVNTRRHNETYKSRTSTNNQEMERNTQDKNIIDEMRKMMNELRNEMYTRMSFLDHHQIQNTNANTPHLIQGQQHILQGNMNQTRTNQAQYWGQKQEQI